MSHHPTTPLRRSPFDLRRTPTATALVHAGGHMTYGELARMVDERRALLGDTRRLVVLEAVSCPEFVATYLACLDGGHPVLLAAPGATGSAAWQSLLDRYDPDVVVTGVGGGWRVEEVRPGTSHELHPDLALLLSTSGSTGSPKLVRLSHDNLASNAEAIAASLSLTAADRAATTLPLHYCYGLSQLHSHLWAGASVWLTDLSVADPEFWAAHEAAGATSLAGVPHTFDLLEQTALPDRLPERLRYLTQAGGALAPERVKELSGTLAGRGVDLVVMYGQTEATARMAVLDPALVATRPATIGRPIGAGSFRLDDGELVFTGPGVMLGYAEGPADLALGRTVDELRTGDLAVQHDDGLWQVVGRRSRNAKLYGVRIDLDRVEALLREHGVAARVATDETRVLVAVRSRSQCRRANQVLADALCLPCSAVDVRVVDQVPLTSTGKTDYPTLIADHPPLDHQPRDVAGLYSWLLGRRDVGPGDSFASLGGDSLSHVEAALRLEDLLVRLPRDWPSATVAELDALIGDRAGDRPARRTRWVETPTVLRAVAIVLVVGSHTEWWDVKGGAHVLLAVLGFNIARFQLLDGDRGASTRRLLRSARDLALIGGGWIALSSWLSPDLDYDVATVLMLNGFVGENVWSVQYHFWFIEAAVWLSLGLAALMAVPAVHRLDRTRPFASALVLLVAAVGYRLAVASPSSALERYEVAPVAWCLALGLAAARTRTWRQRVVVSLLAVVGAWGFFGVGEVQRELVVVGGVLLLVWVRGVRLPAAVGRLVGLVAAASLSIYLTHWVVYRPLDADHDVLAALAGLTVGVLVHLAVRALVRWRRRPTRGAYAG